MVNLIEELDFVVGGDGLINFSEFLAASIDSKILFQDSKLRAVYQMFDVEGKGRISEEHLRNAFKHMGYKLSSTEVH